MPFGGKENEISKKKSKKNPILTKLSSAIKTLFRIILNNFLKLRLTRILLIFKLYCNYRKKTKF